MTYKQTLIIVVILVGTALLTTYVSKSERIEPNVPFAEFPTSIEDFKGVTDKMGEKIINILGVEDYILANFQRKPVENVNLYVGFYQSQKEGDLIHSPKHCMPGAGWKITQTASEYVPIPPDGNEIKVIKLLIQNGNQKQVVLYWFQSRGRIIASEYMQKIWLVVDSITKNRTDGSFVRLIAPVTTSEQETTALLKEFAYKIYPLLTKHIPS